ncbi:hypothetical protein EZV62_018730 [Acer yangbiense]|uniref:Leucine-rich repeat-containing N-terminal plant-type domain-containing protein n=1 Tax=Acer yangbiense TaxID=1000413 RepID=A0A5C7HK64_9ROSI|nr:hypothetical protein EZV62_018730 [Acer yangbiense]
MAAFSGGFSGFEDNGRDSSGDGTLQRWIRRPRPAVSAQGPARLRGMRDMEQWKEDTDCCSWDGVTCDDMGKGHVTGLDLHENGLNGTISSNSTLFLLPYLQDLNLSHNPSLKGSLPEANWSNPLQILDVSYTSFSGRLPDSIGNLKSLTQLDLIGCKFIGLQTQKEMDGDDGGVDGTKDSIARTCRKEYDDA